MSRNRWSVFPRQPLRPLQILLISLFLASTSTIAQDDNLSLITDLPNLPVIDTIATVSSGGSKHNLQELKFTELKSPFHQSLTTGGRIAVRVLGYYLDRNHSQYGVSGGGGIYLLAHDDALVHNGGTTIAADESFDSALGAKDAFWVLAIDSASHLTPEHFGAIGDGAADDTQSVTRWWLSGHPNLAARGDYKVALANNVVATVEPGRSLEADLLGSRFTQFKSGSFLFRVRADDEVGSIVVRGLNIECSDQAYRPLEVFGNGFANQVVIEMCDIRSLLENGSGSASAIAIHVALKSPSVLVRENRIHSVNRIAHNVACQGIVVTNVIGSVNIYNNRIDGVYTPTETDADGIVVDSSNRLVAPTQRQSVQINIYHNELKECAGRFIKIQSANAKVASNRFESLHVPLTKNHKAIDFQFGGCTAYDNQWSIGPDLSIGSGAGFVSATVRATGNHESITLIRNNAVLLEQDLPYFALLQHNHADQDFVITDNVVVSLSSSRAAVKTFASWWIDGIANIHESKLIVERNHLPLSYSLVNFRNSKWGTDPRYGDRTTLVLRDNAINDVSGKSILGNFADRLPYLDKMLVRGNSGLSINGNYVTAKMLDVNSLPDGNHFLFKADPQSTATLLNAPRGYERDVLVTIEGSVQKLTKLDGSSEIRKNRTSSKWYESSGTVR